MGGDWSGTWEESYDGSGWGSAEDNEEMGGYKVQYKPTTWAEDTYFREHKGLGRYRCYVHTLLRWNWIPHDEQETTREDKQGEQEEMLGDNLEQYYDVSSLESWDISELKVLSDETGAGFTNNFD